MAHRRGTAVQQIHPLIRNYTKLIRGDYRAQITVRKSFVSMRVSGKTESTPPFGSYRNSAYDGGIVVRYSMRTLSIFTVAATLLIAAAPATLVQSTLLLPDNAVGMAVAAAHLGGA